MGIKIKVKINPAPCKHSVITVTEDDKERTVVFHDSDFDDAEYVPDAENKRLYKTIKRELKRTGKKLSESKSDIEELVI